MCACVGGMHIPQHMNGAQRTDWFSPSILWIAGISLRVVGTSTCTTLSHPASLSLQFLFTVCICCPFLPQHLLSALGQLPP